MGQKGARILNDQPSKWALWLRLGRVSNLPTVWSNTVAGMLLAGGLLEARAAVVLALAFSFFYVGGMFLNDAFDRNIDAVERPERPIPRGLISARQVITLGYAMLGAGALLVALYVFVLGGSRSIYAVLASLLLGGAVVLYDAWHKGNPLGPLLMGACRVLVYFTAALAVSGRLEAPVLVGGGLLLAYIMGLTYVAKQENLTEIRHLWPLLLLLSPFIVTLPALPNHPAAAVFFGLMLGWVGYAVLLLRNKGRGVIGHVVVSLIGGISLLDALLVSARGASASAAAVTALGFAFTLFFQR